MNTILQTESRTNANLLVLLLGVYVVLLTYASLMPFDFMLDRGQIRNHAERALQFKPFGTIRVPRTDMAANLALYVPLGLLASMRLSVHRNSSKAAALLLAALLILATTVGVEVCQLLSSRRIANVTDTLLNFVGGMSGAVAGIVWGRQWWVILRRQVRFRWRFRPMSLVAVAMLMFLAAEALSPYMPTLDISDLVHSVKNSRLSLAEGLAVHPWHYWAVERIGMYAILTILLGYWAAKPSSRHFFQAGLVAICFAMGAETAKIFIQARSPSLANVVMSLVGVVLAVTLGSLFVRCFSQRVKFSAAVGCLLLYLGYLQWLPFQFVCDLPTAANKLPKGAEWLPLYHYAMGARFQDIQLFSRTILLSGGLILCLGHCHLPSHTRPDWTWALWGTLIAASLGLLLEAGQFALPGRVPSITDVFCFATGGCVGGLLVDARLRSGIIQSQGNRQS